MHAASLALALASILPPPVDPPRLIAADPPQPVCPNGDVPGPLGALDVADTNMALDVDDGSAELTVTRTYKNHGGSPASIVDTLPIGGGDSVVVAATVADDGGPVRTLALEDASVAAGKLTAWLDALAHGVPPEEATAGPHEAGALVFAGEGKEGAGVDVAAPCSVRAVTVAVTARLPSVPVDGAWRFVVPALGPLTVTSRGGPVQVRVDGSAVHPGEPRGLSGDVALPVDVTPLFAPRLRARGFVAHLAATPAPHDEGGEPAPASASASTSAMDVVVARAELDLPRPLSDAPAGLRLVFVVDASVSMGPEALAKELQLAGEILDAAPPDAKYAVVAAARRPRVAVGPWQARTTPPALAGLGAGARVSALDDVLENGSDIPAAVRLAQGIASDVDEGEVPRVVVLSDMDLADAVTPAALTASFAAPLPANRAALTHVVLVRRGDDVEDPVSWSRTFADEDERARAPERTGGIWVDLGGGDDDEAALAPHLIRPTRIDRPRVVLAGKDLLAAPIASALAPSPRDDEERTRQRDGLPSVLVEGSGLRVEAALPASAAKGAGVRALRIRGLVWATPFDERVRDDPALLGLAAIDEVGTALDDDVVRTIAQRTNAVTRVTSLLWLPSWRPARRVVDVETSGCGCTCGGCTCSCCGTFGHGVGVAVDHGARERAVLLALLREDARACLVPRAAVDVEISDHEILAVRTRLGGACVTERMWGHRLDRLVDAAGLFFAHRTLAVDTGGAPGDAR